MTLIQISSKNEKSVTDTHEPISKRNFTIKKNDVNIWLVDPTYTQQQISSEAMPNAIGGIATFTEYSLKLKNKIRLFKYPEKLAVALENEGIPDIIGFSNYMWNCELSLALARRIKEYAADTIVVMGGPNYPVTSDEQEDFLRKHPEIDFYVTGEGELAFTNLVATLINADMKKNNLKEDLPSVHYIRADDKVSISSTIERLKDLTEIPSAYTTGKMDEFFDGKLLPVIQTTRGCPFACTFCVEGTQYYNKVYRTNLEKIEAELDYIGSKMADVRKKGGRNDLWLVDSNFGMYNQDLDTCKAIANCQKKYGWPEYIQCDTGKNNKAKVLDAARLVKGAMRLSGSVQSLDPEVLKNIKRSNIAPDALMQLAMEAAEVDTDSRSEIILALPGETLKSHFDTIHTVINAGFNHVNTYQLMLLPGTEVSSPESRKQFGMKTRYRVLPRCFGYYQVLNRQIKAAEIEEICVSTNTLSFEDYVSSRKMHLLIHLFHNDGLFGSVLKLIKSLKLSVFRWLELLYTENLEGNTNELFSSFEKETRGELWMNQGELRPTIQEPGVIDRYIGGELGYNLLFVYKAIAMKKYMVDLKMLARKTLHKLLIENNFASPDYLNLADSILEFDTASTQNLFHDIDTNTSLVVDYNIPKFLDAQTLQSPDQYKFDKQMTVNFILDEEQKDILKRHLDIYGDTDLGVSRILTKVFVKKILRKPINDSQLASLKIK